MSSPSASWTQGDGDTPGREPQPTRAASTSIPDSQPPGLWRVTAACAGQNPRRRRRTEALVAVTEQTPVTCLEAPLGGLGAEVRDFLVAQLRTTRRTPGEDARQEADA